MLKIRTHQLYEQFYDDIVSNRFFPKITLPTRVDVNLNTATLIDQIYVKLTDRNNSSLSGILESDISDHYPVFAFVYPVEVEEAGPRTILTKSNIVEKIDEIRSELLQINWDNFTENSDSSSVNTRFDEFMQTIRTVIDKHISVKEVPFRKYKHKKSLPS